MNNKNELISVIVPVYNVDKYLERCVKSILNQTHLCLDIILVDDGSTDMSGEICDELAKLDSRIRVVHKQNGGLSSARNAGIMLSIGDYIGFVDSDDYIVSTMYETLFNDIKFYTADISQCGCEIIWNKTRELRSGTGKVYCWDKNEALIQHLQGTLLEPSVCCKLYKKEIFDTLRFDETIKLSEDIPFNVEAFKISRKVVFRDKCLYKYVKRDNSLSRSDFNKREIATINQSKKILESLRDEDEGVTNSAYAKLFGTIISVYNHSLFSDADFADLRCNLKKSVSNEFSNKGKRKGFNSSQKVAYYCLRWNEPLYILLVKLRRLAVKRKRD